MDLFVVTKNLRDTVRLVEAVGADKVGTVNIGGAQKKKDGKQLYRGVILDDDDIECVRELIKLVGNKNVDSRTIPSDALQDMESILKKY
jgi:mannose/fructose/N-acetylgalactosamine-specific phosphotransferase system component IIB